MHAVVVLFLAFLTTDPVVPMLDPTNLGMPFQRYTVPDSFGRTITFYLSVAPKDQKAVPVVLFIQGSGCQSLFRKQGERVGGGMQNLLYADAKGRYRVLVVEKPGVKYLDFPERPGSAIGSSEEFRKEHTLPRWAEANAAALRAAWTLPGIDATRSLVMGHSEGGLTAAKVAAMEPKVTHVASLAGGGPTQLFDLAETFGQPRPDEKPGDAEKRVQMVHDGWAKVQKDPDSISEDWLGHPHRRWSSFLSHSVTEELLKTKAKIYLAQGTSDTAVSVKSHDVLVAELRARNRPITVERIDGADHGFRPAGKPPGPPDEMKALFGRILGWYLEEKKAEK